MDQPALLSGEALTAGLKLIEDVAPTHPIEVAFWMGRSDAEHFNLYLASSEFAVEDRLLIRHHLGLAARALDSIYLDPWSIRVVGIDEPITQWAIQLRQDHQGVVHSWNNPVRFQGKSVGPMYVYSERNLASFAFV